jgi:hypothetical protein
MKIEVSEKHDDLWPFGARAALLAVPIAWIVFGAALWASHKWMTWPTAKSSSGVVYVAALLSLIPLGLYLLDYVARRRGSVGFGRVSVKFGSDDVLPERQFVVLETDLGFPGEPIDASSVAAIHQALNRTAGKETVRIDIASGWWETRLFALCAGAVWNKRPAAIIFLEEGWSMEGFREDLFLGWIRPRDALDRLRARSSELKLISDRAFAIGRHLTMFGPPDLRLRAPEPVDPYAPTSSSPAEWPPPRQREGHIRTAPGAPQLSVTIADYARREQFQNLGEDAFLRVLLDLIGKYEETLMPEGPRRLTAESLSDLFRDALSPPGAAINTHWSRALQLEVFLGSPAEYMAIVAGSRFVGLLPRGPAESAILRQLVHPGVREEPSISVGP